MRARILGAILALAVAAGLVGGVTVAWLGARADMPAAEFTAGTVLIEAGEVTVGHNQPLDNWRPGECAPLTYQIANAGSKCMLLRARYEGRWWYRQCETAMVRMNDSPTDFTYRWPGPQPGGFHPWFSYIIHEPAASRKTFYFYAAQHYRVGEVDVWKDDDYLYVEVRLDDGYEMTESHVNVQTSLEGLTSLPGGGLSFGQWPYIREHVPAVSTFQYRIPWKDDWTDIDLYIGVHADVCVEDWLEWDPGHFDKDGNPVEVVSVQPCDSSWIKGTDGYLYYVGDGNCLEGIPAGHTVALCLEVCLDDEADGRYQQKLYTISVTFEAIQCSNRAAYDQGWQFTCQS